MKQGIRLTKVATDRKHPEYCVPTKVHSRSYLSYESKQGGGGFVNNSQKYQDSISIVSFLTTFPVHNDISADRIKEVISGITKGNTSTEMNHGQLSDKSNVHALNNWVIGSKVRQQSRPVKDDFGNRDKNSREATCLITGIKAATGPMDIHTGSIIHADLTNRGLLKESDSLSSASMNMYAKCGSLEKTREVFTKLSTQDVVVWNALIAAFVQRADAVKPLVCFDCMQQAGLSPDATTYSCVLKACGSAGALEKGIAVHREIIRRGYLCNIILGNALIDMYGKCGPLEKAQKVFNEMPAWDIVSWTTLISGYCQHGQGKKALNCFKQMQDEGLSPDAVTMRCILKACGIVRAAEMGKELHAQLAREGLLGKDNDLGSALVDMYAKCGAIAAAQEAFDELPVKDIVSWTALIAGYAEDGQGEKAFCRFQEMTGKGVLPNVITLLCLLKACWSMGAADKGQAIHAQAIRDGMLEKDSAFGNALVDMYAKCGAVYKSHHVFTELSKRTVVSWTALIAGYGRFGMHNTVFNLFDRMSREGVEPNSVTFLVVLTSCNRSCLVKEGQWYFDLMSKIYGIVPNLNHCTCMVSLLGQSGHFDMALIVLKKMLLSMHLAIWHVLLTACRKWGNISLGYLAFDRLICREKMNAMCCG